MGCICLLTFLLVFSEYELFEDALNRFFIEVPLEASALQKKLKLKLSFCLGKGSRVTVYQMNVLD